MLQMQTVEMAAIQYWLLLQQMAALEAVAFLVMLPDTAALVAPELQAR